MPMQKTQKTQVWINFAESCEDIDSQIATEFLKETEEIGKLIQYMINNTGKFGVME